MTQVLVEATPTWLIVMAIVASMIGVVERLYGHRCWREHPVTVAHMRSDYGA